MMRSLRACWTSAPSQGEMQVMRPRTRPHQMILGSTRPVLPAWRSLPTQCREELVQLLAQLIKVHAGRRRAIAPAAEVDDE